MQLIRKIFNPFVFVSLLLGEWERPKQEGADALWRREREEAGLTQVQGDDSQGELGRWSGA